MKVNGKDYPIYIYVYIYILENKKHVSNHQPDSVEAAWCCPTAAVKDQSWAYKPAQVNPASPDHYIIDRWDGIRRDRIDK